MVWKVWFFWVLIIKITSKLKLTNRIFFEKKIKFEKKKLLLNIKKKRLKSEKINFNFIKVFFLLKTTFKSFD